MDKYTMYSRPTAAQILEFAVEAKGYALQLACDPQIGDHRLKEASARAAGASALDSYAASEWDGTADPTEYDYSYEDEGDSSAALAVGKGKGKSKSKSKKGTTICREFATDARCPLGDRCWYLHPSSERKCFRCGAVTHTLSNCPRPKRDPKPSAVSSSAKASLAPAKAPRTGKGKGKSKGKGASPSGKGEQAIR